VLFGSNHTQEPTAYNPNPQCFIKAASGVSNVLKPQGTFYMYGIDCQGGTYTGAGSGACLAEGAMSGRSWVEYVHIHNNQGGGILNAHGVHHAIELSDNTTNSNALGVIGAGVKGVDEFNIQHSYVHNTQGNGIWCDIHCNDQSDTPFQTAHFNSNLVVNNGRAGIRWERIGGPDHCGSDCSSDPGEGIIENNRVAGNGFNAVRGGIDIRDSQRAVVRNNIIGPQSVAGVSYGHNVNSIAVRVSDSGRSDRPDLWDIDVVNNDLISETIKGCELPDEVVFCSGNF